MIVYIAKNVKTGKCYVGQTTKRLKDRQKMHVWLAFSGRSNTHFHRALRKYGYGAFKWRVVARCTDKSSLDAREKLEIAKRDRSNLYNLTSGGEGTPGYRRSKETREQDRIRALMRPPMSAESRAKMSEYQRTRPCVYDPNTKLKIAKVSSTDAKRLYNVSKTHYHRIIKWAKDGGNRPVREYDKCYGAKK